MLSLLLASVIITGLSELYLQQKLSHEKLMTLLEVQQRAYYVAFLLGQYIRQAGDRACMAQPKRNSLMENAIAGYEYSNAPAIWKKKLFKNSDLVMLGRCRTFRGYEHFVRSAYYIGDTHRHDKQHEKIYALYRQPIDGRREELIAGVSMLHIIYGIGDGQGDINQYVKASRVKDWRRVKSIQVDIVLQSINKIKLLRGKFDYLKQPWSFYFALRNNYHA